MLTPPDASVSKIIYGSEGYIAPERLHGRPGDYRADVFSVGALWYAMLVGTALPDPLDAEPCSALDKMPLPPRLRAVLRGALDVRDRRHHSAASMAEALRVAVRDIAAQQQRKRRAWWLAPGLGALILPTWLAVRSTPPTIDCTAAPLRTLAAPLSCPPAAEPPQATVSPSVDGSATIGPAVLQGEVPVQPQADVKVAQEAIAAPDNKRPPAPRFDRRAALAKCKPHPTTRLVIKYDPAGPLKINDGPPQGEMGRCVADVLQHHPPRRAGTLTP